MLKKFVVVCLALLLVVGVIMVSANALMSDSDQITKIKAENSVVVRPFTYSLRVDSLVDGEVPINCVFINGEFYDIDNTFFGSRYIVTGDTFFTATPELYDPYMRIASQYDNPVLFFEVCSEDPSFIDGSEIYVNGHKLTSEEMISVVCDNGERDFVYYVTEPLEE